MISALKEALFFDFYTSILYVKYTMYIAPILRIKGFEVQFKGRTREVYDRVGRSGDELAVCAIKYAGRKLRSFRRPCLTRLFHSDTE